MQFNLNYYPTFGKASKLMIGTREECLMHAMDRAINGVVEFDTLDDVYRVRENGAIRYVIELAN